MKSYDDVKIVQEHGYTRPDGQTHTWTSESISLEKLVDKRIKDVTVSVSTGYGDPILTFHDILFEDGSEISLEGQHDVVFSDGMKGAFPTLTTKQLVVLYNESNGFKPTYEDGEEDDEYLNPEDYDDE